MEKTLTIHAGHLVSTCDAWKPYTDPRFKKPLQFTNTKPIVFPVTIKPVQLREVKVISE